MQRRFYSKLENPMYNNDDVVSNYDPIKNMLNGFKGVALDFGCGLGRSIKLYKQFKRIDGADISQRYIDYCKENFKSSRFYLTNGIDLKPIWKDRYDVVFSVTF